MWLYFSASPPHDEQVNVVDAIEILQNVSQRKIAEEALRKTQAGLEHLITQRTSQLARSNARLEEDIRRREEIEAELLWRNVELTEMNQQFSTIRKQLAQADKMVSIGQLAAGVAHEINNPIGYIFSNFGTLQTYLTGLLDMLDAYKLAEPLIGVSTVRDDLQALRERIELDYLKDFSRVDSDREWQWTNLHQGIESTLNIVNSEVKYKADVSREFGNLPEIECLASQISQIIMNLVVNAA